MSTIGLVGCSSVKLQHAAPARDLYRSALFRKSVAWVEPRVDRWFILSALHGLLHPDTVIEPYNLRLGTRSGPPIWPWAGQVRAQLDVAMEGEVDPTFIIVAGEQYRSILNMPPRFPWGFTVPLAGLSIGEQLHWLTVS